MSQGNVEIVRRSTDAYNRRDIDGILENWAHDAVLDWSNSRGFETGVYRGQGEIRAFTERFLAAWDEVRIEMASRPHSRSTRRSRKPAKPLAGRSRLPADWSSP